MVGSAVGVGVAVGSGVDAGVGVAVTVGVGVGVGVGVAVGVGVGVEDAVGCCPDVHVTELPSALRTHTICEPVAGVVLVGLEFAEAGPLVGCGPLDCVVGVRICVVTLELREVAAPPSADEGLVTTTLWSAVVVTPTGWAEGDALGSGVTAGASCVRLGGRTTVAAGS